jgi:CDGSH iron-sulfur domain-containing protein 3
MAEPIIAQKGPYVQMTSAGTYWWCSCGGSKTQPFCDGTHKGSGFAPRRADIASERQVAWCGCKRSKNAPLCDGSHRGL